jgi:uncharacterized membrane protein HdeD (DUF308 family)
MVQMLARNWGWILLRGIAAILFGVFTIFNPGIALTMLTLFFGAYAMTDGVFMIASAVANRRGEPHWWALLVGGLLGIAVGSLTFLLPHITAVALLALIATWSIFVGVAEFMAAIKLRKVITGEWVLMLAGVASVAFGVLLLARPLLGALTVVLWIGAFALTSGILLTGFAFRVRSWGHSPAAVAPRAQQHGVTA